MNLNFIIILNLFFFSNNIFSKIYNNKGKYPLICLLYNSIIGIISIIIYLFIKYFIINKIFPINEGKTSITDNKNQTVFEKNNLNKVIRFIIFEITKKVLIIIYFIVLFVIVLYSIMYSISFGIVFHNSQKFILLNVLMSLVFEDIFCLIFNLFFS